MSNILIAGGAGNIGCSLVNKLSLDPNYNLVIVDNLSTGNIRNIPERDNVKFVKADVNNCSDIVAIFGRYKFDYVFHFAAVVGVERTLENPISVLNDIEGIKNILSLSKNSGVKRVFYASSSEVYGEPFEIPQNEKTTPLNSRLPYAIVKNVGEAFFRAYQKEYDLSYTIFRLFNTYGPYQSNDFVIPRFLKLAMNDQPLPIYGDGKQTRSFCYIDDNIDTCIAAMNNNTHINDVLNIGNDVELSILKLAHIIKKTVDSKSEIIHLPALNEGDMKRRCPDISKMKSLLKRDLIPLEVGIKKLIKYYSIYRLE